MAKWYYEDGIGEERAILVDGGTMLAARVEWNEGSRTGLVVDAKLETKRAGAQRGTARLPDGSEALVDRLPRDATEGAILRLRIVRPAIHERGRTKLPLARPAPDEVPCPAPSLLEELHSESPPVHVLRTGSGTLAEYGWDELIESALTGEVTFPGGSLLVSLTPAMTLIDVDGTLAPTELALAAVPHVAATLARLDLGGSVGIDFPSLAQKRDRQAVDAALGAALEGWRGERTAMNGFGFVQLVSRLERPSLIARYARRTEAHARILLRQAERVSEPGALLLTAPPAVRRAARSEWQDELARRTGRRIEWREDAGLAPEAAFAQAVPS